MPKPKSQISPSTFAEDVAVRVVIIRSGPRGPLTHSIQKWCKGTRDARIRGLLLDDEDCCRLADAEVAFENPESSVVVAVNVDAGQLDRLTERARYHQVELIVVSQDRSIRSHTPPFQVGHITVTAGDPTALLRTALLRLRANLFTRTEPISFDRLPDYFALRYRVWKDLGYLEDRVDHERGWEANYSDLTALPIGIFLRQDNRLIGCARLVRQKGAETSYANEVRNAVECSAVLSGVVNEVGFDHSFDMFEAFSGFWDYYRPLARGKIPRAEVSRMIVDPDKQGYGLGEVLAGHLVAYAREIGIQRLFLGCRTEHERFYGRCGFTKIEGLNTDRFGGAIDVKAIAMDLDLAKSP